MDQSKVRKSFFAVIGSFMFIMPATTLGDDNLEQVAKTVDFSDLDISDAPDAEVLYRRLKRASRSVCGLQSLRISATVRVMAQQKRCYWESLEAAVAQLGHPELSRIHAGNQKKYFPAVSMTKNE